MAESKSESVEIRPLQPTDSVERITEILHLAYAGLADLGFKYFATHQSPEQTRSRLQNGEPFVALLSGEIVGTVTLYTSTLHDNQAPLLYQQPDVGYFGQFGVLPEHQGSRCYGM